MGMIEMGLTPVKLGSSLMKDDIDEIYCSIGYECFS